MFPSDNDFHSQFTFEQGAVPLPDEPPFHALMLGNWSGDSVRKSLPDRRPIVIDRDNFDQVLKRLNVKLELDLQGDGQDPLMLEFSEIDDFHPDNLFRQVPLFADLRDVRRRLSASDTFEKAAAEIRSWFNSPAEQSINDDAIKSDLDDSPPIDSGNLLDMILTKPGDSAAPAKIKISDNSELGRFVSKIVSPYLVKIDENEQAKLISAVDEIISESMRAILHHPKFQALESAWRGLYFLVRRLETDVDLKIFILDVSKPELNDNLKSVSDLTDSFLYRLLSNQLPGLEGSDAFSVIGADYSFGPDVDDIALLIRLAKVSSSFNTSFISYIRPEIFGIKDFSQSTELSQFNAASDSNEFKLWTTLRSIPEASYLGLSPMKILNRVPYGELSDSVESFSFEEFKDPEIFSNYLWMNPCFSVVLLLSQSYRLYGWEMGDGIQNEIKGLPLFVYQIDGESKAVPCAEVVLNESSLEKLLDQGFLTLVGFRDTDKIRVPRFQAISSELSKLKGKWDR